MKKLFETIIGITVALVVVLVLLVISLKFAFQTPENESNIMGVETTEEQTNKIILDSTKFQSNNSEGISFSSAIYSDKILYFDNTNRGFLEGVTYPNSTVNLQIGDFFQTTTSDPSGFFSLELNSEIQQFSKGQITVFDSDNKIRAGIQFAWIYRKYFNRTYFLIIERNEVFSLVVSEDYQTPRDNIYILSNNDCKSTLNPILSSESFDFSKNTSTIIFPTTITSLDFSQNKFVAFDIRQLNDDYANCKIEWYSYSNTLNWETDRINELFQEDEKLLPTTIPNPNSSPI